MPSLLLPIFIAGFALQTSARTISSEPGCSRFDYEERILEKLVRMELGMKILEDKFEEWESAMKSKLTAFDKAEKHAEARLTALQGEMTEQLETYINEKTNEIEDLQDNLKVQLEGVKEKTKFQKVAFYAQLTNNMDGVGNFQPIVYNLVTTNHGNGYNEASGIFTAPVSGMYVLFWTSANEVRSHMQTELVVNSVAKGRTWSDAHDHEDVAVASNTVVLSLNSGDVAWIRSNSINSGAIMGNQLSTFSGWLLF